jgi:hypothetical protein
MIPVNELRIGNKVLVKYKEDEVGYGEDVISTIESIQSQKVRIKEDEYWHRCEDIEGVVLTSEILEKCGFVKQNGYPYKFLYGYLRLRNSVFFFKYHDIEIEILYLHQLQNLYFALTGEELNIQL